jgi:hypothetical protein
VQETGCFSVNVPAIPSVLDLRSGEIPDVRHAIGNDYGEAIKLRMRVAQALRNKKPIYACPLCHVPVYLVSMPDRRRFYFRHDIEDGRCPAKTRGALSEEEINARKYNGVKESDDHKEMKEIVFGSLQCDPRFSDIRMETRWKGMDGATWRKPDVSATYEGTRIAFEIQLSTTFLRVIAERRNFYLEQGGLLCWIFKSYDNDYARLTQDDVFYNNNRNLFIANRETLDASRAAGEMVLDCRWVVPSITSNGQMLHQWDRALTRFSELTFDIPGQRIYTFDYDQIADHVHSQTTDERLRTDFDAFWLSHRTYDNYDKEQWRQLRTGFRAKGIRLPERPHSGDGPVYLLNALYSAREGVPIGSKHFTLIQVAHNIADGHKMYLRIFMCAVKAYGRVSMIVDQDRTGKWKSKVDLIKHKYNSGHQDFEHDSRFDALARFLFPEVF